MAFMRKSYTIGNQRGTGNYGKHATPSRFPELSYWPSLQMFSKNKDARAATSSQHRATPVADPGATPGGGPSATPATDLGTIPGAGPSVTPAGSKPVDISLLPPHKGIC